MALNCGKPMDSFEDSLFPTEKKNSEVYNTKKNL